MWKSICLPNFDVISQSTAEIKLLPFSENWRPSFWNSISGFDFAICIVIGMSFCICLPNFVVIRRSSAELWRYIYFFKMAAGSHIGFDLVNVRPHTKCNCRSELDPQICFDPIYSFGDIAIFIFCVLVGNCPFTPIFGEFWGHIPPNMDTHRSNPQNDHPCAETRRLSHKGWKSIQRFDLGLWIEKKVRTGQNRTVKNVTRW